MKKIVVALGGNALGLKIKDQLEAVNKATYQIAKLIEEGHQVVIVHGNGPQVGMIQLAFAQASKVDTNVETMPLVESIAMSQGYIGFHLQNSLINHLKNMSIDKSVITISTQIQVDAVDESFNKPTKPIGPFYSKDEIISKSYDHYIEDAGRGYRQVVASPMPQEIIELEAIKSGLSSNQVIICCGGGGIPVISYENGIKAVDAVIDKDAAASLLAKKINADLLLILTEVEQVSLNFGKNNQVNLLNLSIEDAERYIEEGHFAPGSMLPKVSSALRFVQSNPRSEAIITSLECVKDALSNRTGTHFKE